MTYFGFLGWFLILPIILLLTVGWFDGRSGRVQPESTSAWPPVRAIGLHVLIAMLYTTLWDNYLVATQVWWYDPERVTGLTLGWVPIEEYTFFVLQPILGGLWLFFLMRRLGHPGRVKLRGRLRLWSVLALSVLWLLSAVVLFSDWRPGSYMALELVWALPPIALQLGFGADILWSQRRLISLSILPLTLFLSLADALAIVEGIWTISPEQSLGILLGGVLPIEEALFFLLTNTLVIFGVTLVTALVSHERIKQLIKRVQNRPKRLKDA